MQPGVRALCTDFYVNQKLALKMDLPCSRETLLDMFDRVRRELPDMDRFRRFEDEVALESPDDESQYSWMAIRQTSVRSGCVNPEALHGAYRLHKLILDLSPYYLSVSPLDVDYIELVFGFDLSAEANRNEVVFEALFGHSPLQQLIDQSSETVLDSQPFVGFALSPRCDLQAFVEVKTRTQPRELGHVQLPEQPISVYLTVRKYGPLKSIDDFSATFGMLAGHVERLAEDRVIPHVVMPIRETLMGEAT